MTVFIRRNVRVGRKADDSKLTRQWTNKPNRSARSGSGGEGVRPDRKLDHRRTPSPYPLPAGERISSQACSASASTVCFDAGWLSPPPIAERSWRRSEPPPMLIFLGFIASG